MPSQPPPSVNEQNMADFRVTFNPPLYLQRQIWLLGAIQSERVSCVLDVGCGEASLLAALAQPAPWLPDTLPARWAYTHARTLHGLDISPDALAAARGTIQSMEADPDDGGRRPRWARTDAVLWRGGIEHVNEVFKGIECVVATEVIEHLPPDIFPSFAPVLLGCYAPRLLLLTTPSYTYNTFFRPPSPSPASSALSSSSSSSSTTWGFLDPTGRTTRRFRHVDHKLEFTPDEWRTWCAAAADAWGYDVDVDAIGRAEQRDPWARDGSDPRATLVAVFRRRDDGDSGGGKAESENNSGGAESGGRAARWAAWATEHLIQPQTSHERYAEFTFDAHEAAGMPRSTEEILSAVRVAMRQMKAGTVELRELWNDVAIAGAAGGRREVLVSALEGASGEGVEKAFDIDRAKAKDAEEWSVRACGEEGEELRRIEREADERRESGWAETRYDWRESWVGWNDEVAESQDSEDGDDVGEEITYEDAEKVSEERVETVDRDSEAAIWGAVATAGDDWDTANDAGWRAPLDKGVGNTWSTYDGWGDATGVSGDNTA